MKILIVDDEKIERNGIKFLLSKREEKLDIYEASNGKEALEILKKERMDILFTDIKMPFITGTELVQRARKQQEDLEMVIFSGYGEFSYAKQAIKYGVEDYVLKPVNPIEFHTSMDRICEKIKKRDASKLDDLEKKEELEAYYFIKYLYQGSSEYLEKIREKINLSEWKKIHMLLLIESDDSFFEENEEESKRVLCKEVQQNMSFLNLSPERELCILKSECDTLIFAKHVLEVLEQNYGKKFYVAAGNKLNHILEIPESFKKIDLLMENKFYKKKMHVFVENQLEEDIPAEQVMSVIIENMVEDIHLNDMIHLEEHFQLLKKQAEHFQSYSQIYTKFLFSNLVKEIYEQQQIDGKPLEGIIQKVYELPSIDDVLKEIESLILSFGQQLRLTKESSRNEVERAKSYIYAHFKDEISVEILAEQVFLSPGYFSYIFKKETGQNLSKFVKEYRIERAKKYLAETNMKIVHICEETGFSNVSYFIKSFREYCGCTPEQYRKGEGKDEQMDSKV